MTGFLRAFQISACTYLVVKAPEGREGRCQEARILGKSRPEKNKLASLEATLVETTTHPLTDGGEV